MLKKIVKKISYFFYKIGYFESVRIESEKRQKRLNEMALIGENVWISAEALILNNAHPKEKFRIGKNSRIMGSLLLFDFDGEIEIGEDCFIGPSTRIWSAKKIKIGSRVLIAHNVNIHDNISHPLDANERYNENLHFVNTGIHTKTDIKPAEIIIGDDVWIGFNATIMRGVKIGEGAIIGANTLVKEDIAPWTVNIGNPSRVIRTIESDK
jgi:acetyltransferase-like isoleucine patch superfamily enzyme